MIENLAGLYDEFQSAHIAVCALTDALHRADRFSREGISKALDEAATARNALAIEILEFIDANMQGIES